MCLTVYGHPRAVFSTGCEDSLVDVDGAAPGSPEARALTADLTAYYDQEALLRDKRAIDPQRVDRRTAFAELLRRESRSNLVEFGTGPGRDAKAFIASGIRVAGVDLADENVRLARSTGVDAHRASVLALPFEDGVFDAGWTMSHIAPRAERAVGYRHEGNLSRAASRRAVGDRLVGWRHQRRRIRTVRRHDRAEALL